MVGTTAFAQVVDTGSCGTGVTWTVTGTEGNYTLTISGTGTMTNYWTESSVPWKTYRAGIKNAIVESGVTTIGASAFYGCAITSFEVHSGITAIGGSAFQSCSNLTSVTVWPTTATLGTSAFLDCSANIYVLADKVDAYKAATNWKSYKTQISAITADQANNSASGAYWSTYYNGNYAVEADANTTVYKVSVAGTKATLTEISDRIVNAGQGVVLKSTTGPTTLTIYSSATETTDDYTGNELTGVDENTTISGSAYDGKSIYTLANASGFGFYKFAGATLGANKAFLAFNSDVAARDFFLFEDETTGINEAVKVNTSAQYFDLQGRSIAQPTKGLYIVNGKKVIVK